MAVYTKKPSYPNSLLKIYNAQIENTKKSFFVTNENELFIDEKKYNKKINNNELLRIIYRQNKEVLSKYE